MADDLLNTQIRDAVNFANHTLMGNAASESASMLDALMAETVGMAMYNAVNTQHNAQTVGNAAVAASCARMLKVPSVPWLPPAPVGNNPVVTGVTPTPGVANSYAVTGCFFVAPLTVEILQDGPPFASLSGPAITNQSASSFTVQVIPLPAGAYKMQVLNGDGLRSKAVAFTVSASQLMVTEN